jgi:naphthoate synthase
MTYTDILYDKRDGVAWITINRPETRNAFRTRTVHELTDAFQDARWDPSVGVVVLTGAGDKAFCSGGDQKERGSADSADGDRPMCGRAALAIRHCPKPVIAMVNGFAIGGGHVLHVLCDFHRLRQRDLRADGAAGGSVDAGHGTGYLRGSWARRRRRARSGISAGSTRAGGPRPWASSTRSSPEGPAGRVEQWCRELLEKSPTAGAGQAIVQHRLEPRAGVAEFAPPRSTSTPDRGGMEGRNAFVEKRPVNFKHRSRRPACASGSRLASFDLRQRSTDATEVRAPAWPPSW